MTPHSNGRHCVSCDKVVRDFSQMSDTQLAYVLQNMNGSTCGHFRKDQIDRAISIAKERRSPDLLAVVLGMTLLLSTYPAFANEAEPKSPEISLIEMLSNPETKPIDGHEYINVKFRIVHAETKEPLPFISIAIYDSNDVVITGAISDEAGYLTFKLTPDQKASAAYLGVRALQYEENVFQWDEKWKDGFNGELELQEMEYLIDGFMIIEPYEEE